MSRTLRWLWLALGLLSSTCKSPTGNGGGNGGGGGGGGSAVASVTVSPETACLAVGQTVQLMATLKDSAGNVVTGPSVAWQSNDVPVASVDQTGLVTGGMLGSATITATSKGRSGTAGIALQTGTATASLRYLRFRFAVGDSGAMLHLAGGNWNPVCSGTTSDLHAMTRNGLGIVFAVGANGTILKQDTVTGSWTGEVSGTTSTLYGLARAPGAIYGTLLAVGASGTVLGYDGAKWSTQSSGTTNTLSSVGKLPGVPVDFAVGAGGTILYYDGQSWRAQASGTTSDLFFLMVLDTNDVYAVGGGGTILHYHSATWTPIPVSGLTVTLRAADVAVDTTGVITDYFVVGDRGTILHSPDGVSWSPQSSGTTNDLFGVTVNTDSNAYAVGALGTILYYNGTAWSKVR